ncbi:MAG: LysR family transcriptional regulator [Pseudomonadota bacterium]
MTTTDWDDLALFAAVAREGSLARAATATGLTSATLGRRMKALEDRLNRRLFQHGQAGYTLTQDGIALSEKVHRMEVAAAEITDWNEDAHKSGKVRLSAGYWTSLYLAENLTSYWSPSADWAPEFVYCDAFMDIARREIDIGIRNTRPTQPWLAGQKTGTVQHAIYGRDKEVTGWIGPGPDTRITPSTRWVDETHGDRVVAKINAPHLSLALARQGVGRVVMPMFIGETRDGVIRLSDPIPELESEEWLVSHHDGRNAPHTRAALDALAQFLKTRAP